MVSLLRLRRWSANGLIAALLLLLIADALPLTPDAVRGWVTPIVNRLGIGQGPWSMFAPPDRVNHRLSAKITLRNGHVIEHRFPDLTTLSVWQRFVGHRRSEYVDNLTQRGRQYPELWQHLADELAENFREQGHEVDQVRMIVEQSAIPPPDTVDWPPRSQTLPFDDQQVVFRRKYR